MTDRLIVQEDQGSVRVLLQREGYVVPDACAPVPFANPFTDQEREDLRWYLEDYLQLPYAVYEERGGEIEGRLEEWGQRLFDAVFGAGKPGRDVYVKARAGRKAAELILASSAPGFLGLPWELLKDPDRATPLALDLAGIDRTISVATESEEIRRGDKLRVLMVIARPEGSKDVGYRMIARPLLKRLEPVAGEVALEVLRPPTLDALKQKLTEAAEQGEPYQILHFDGHGTFGEAAPAAAADPRFFRQSSPQGYLLFETEAGGKDLIAAADFALVLKAAQVPLVVFNACRSGTIAGGVEPEAAVATRLIEGGTAAVVAMSYSVYVRAAAEFMATFYEALFAGKTVAQAVTEGRRRLHRAPLRPSPKGDLPLRDWIVPVHYLRREIAFPGLRRTRPAGKAASLEESLNRLGAASAAGRPAADGAGAGDLPAPVGRFVGRDVAFYELERALRLRRVVVVHGTGGTGKTELAKAFARWWRDTGGVENPDLVSFHSFEPGIASFGLDGVVTEIGLRLFGPDFIGRTAGPEQRRDVVLDVLRRHRMLLVWGNFETVHSMPDPAGIPPPLDAAQCEAMRGFLAALVAGGESGVIVTSRSPEPWLGDVHRVELRGLTAAEAADYADVLLAPLPQAQARRRERAYAELLEFLGGHPLSLRLVLPHLERAPAAALLAALRGGGELPEGFGGGAGRLESLGACVAYSFDHLGPERRRRLPVLALFEGIADAGVLAIFSEVEGVPERFRGVSGEAWMEILDAAAAVGLLSVLGGGMYALHPALPGYLTALWRREAGAGFAAEHAAARATLLIAHAAFGQWLFDQIQGGAAETAMAVIALQRRTLGRFVEMGLEQGRFAEAQAILQPLDAFWNARGLAAEARGWTDRCRVALEGPAAAPPDLDTPAGALWLFVVGAAAGRSVEARDLDAAEAACDAIRRMLERSASPSAQQHLAVSYHQLGRVAQERGDLAAAERWYGQALEIEEALGNRPGMALTYGALGLLSEQRGQTQQALDWMVRCVVLFPEFPHPSTGPGPHHLARLTAALGMAALEESWRRCTGAPLPEAVRAALPDLMAQVAEAEEQGAPRPHREARPGRRRARRKALGRSHRAGRPS